MSEGRVVHIRDNIPGAIYIGRAMPGLKASPFANPFRIGPDGARRHVIAKYRNHLDGLLASRTGPDAALALIAIRGKPLACWCRHDGEAKTPDNACHGDVLLDLLDRHTDDELRAMAT